MVTTPHSTSALTSAPLNAGSTDHASEAKLHDAQATIAAVIERSGHGIRDRPRRRSSTTSVAAVTAPTANASERQNDSAPVGSSAR
jgi:hypothetical protein